jgi:lipoic acid synthetase
MTGKRTDAIKKNETTTIPKNNIIENLLLTPVCIKSHCPNQCKCLSQGTATFRILGDICTRNCAYCYYPQGKPLPIDPDEPFKVAESAKQLNLKYVTITAVNRDDLPDGGASQFARVTEAIHQSLPDTSVELLIHDFGGNTDALKIVADSSPEVIAHNLDTVPRLYEEVNRVTDYSRSLQVLESLKSWNPDIVTKSGMILGLGENDYEVIKVMKDALDCGCNCLTIGQYLPPSTRHHELIRYISSQEFSEYQSLSLQMGYLAVRSGPFVRSSFDAFEMYKEIAQ